MTGRRLPSRLALVVLVAASPVPGSTRADRTPARSERLAARLVPDVLRRDATPALRSWIVVPRGGALFVAEVPVGRSRRPVP